MRSKNSARILSKSLPSLPNETALGRDAYLFFLRNVALMPYSPEELLAMGRQEWNRSVAFEAYEKNRNKDVPPLKIADNMDDWVADTAAKELQIRKFLGSARDPHRARLDAALHAAADARIFARARIYGRG